MVVPLHQRLTYRDLLRMPDDGHRYELIDGEAYVIPSPDAKHQTLLLDLGVAFKLALDSSPPGTRVFIAPLDVVLADDTVLQPDLLVIAPGGKATIVRVVEGPPALAVEILSPTSSRRDRGIKRATYARFGVGEYWLVDLVGRTIEVYRLEAGPQPGYRLERIHGPGDVLTTPLLPALALDLAKLFSAPATA
jgi:Uma2 family endonuclease